MAGRINMVRSAYLGKISASFPKLSKFFPAISRREGFRGLPDTPSALYIHLLSAGVQFFRKNDRKNCTNSPFCAIFEGKNRKKLHIHIPVRFAFNSGSLFKAVSRYPILSQLYQNLYICDIQGHIILLLTTGR